MPTSIDDIMEQATAALMATQYLTAERLCLDALRLAREQQAFGRYARILMPLQEARRLRRQIAVERGVHVIAGPRQTPEQIVAEHDAGCLMLIDPPYTGDDAVAVRRAAREADKYIEVLLLDAEAQRQCFEQQLEREGDAALASIGRKLSPVERVDALAAVVERVGDHEIAHQRLEHAAEEAARSL